MRPDAAWVRSSVAARGYLAGVGAVAFLLGLSGVIAAPEPAGKLVGGIIAVPSLWFTIRTLRSGLRVEGERVLIAGMFRSKTIDRSEITAVEMVPSGGLLPWRRLALRLTNKRSLEVPEVSALAVGSRGRDRVDLTRSAAEAVLRHPWEDSTRPHASSRSDCL